MQLVINGEPYSMDKKLDRQKAARALDGLTENSPVEVWIGNWETPTKKAEGKKVVAKRGKPKRKKVR
jgi:hypothetical protein